jgi:hypothetical protein
LTDINNDFVGQAPVDASSSIADAFSFTNCTIVVACCAARHHVLACHVDDSDKRASLSNCGNEYDMCGCVVFFVDLCV